METTEQRWLTAFIDESGTFDLEIEKSGASNLFVCVAVICNELQSELVKSRMLEISRDEFSGSEVKSSGIGGSHKRRLRVLEKIQDLSFGYYALIINKAEIERDSGLQFKVPFYKYLNRMLYNRLLQGGTALSIVADEIGGKTFMESFVPYLKEKGKPDLFTTWNHRFVSSKETPQVQLADLIAGTLNWCFDKDKRCEHSDVYRELLRPKEIGISSWPLQYREIPTLEDEKEASIWDEHIQACSINRALKFIAEYNEHGKEDRRMQVAVLRHLLFVRQFEDMQKPANRFSDELIHHLKQQGFPELSRQQFSSKVVGPMRDWGILISGGSDGYRLAFNVADIRRYLNHDTNIIKPMLARLNIARQGILQDTTNQYDVLDNTDFSLLKTLTEAMSDHDINEALLSKKVVDEELESGELSVPKNEPHDLEPEPTTES